MLYYPRAPVIRLYRCTANTYAGLSCANMADRLFYVLIIAYKGAFVNRFLKIISVFLKNFSASFSGKAFHEKYPSIRSPLSALFAKSFPKTPAKSLLQNPESCAVLSPDAGHPAVTVYRERLCRSVMLVHDRPAFLLLTL